MLQNKNSKASKIFDRAIDAIARVALIAVTATGPTTIVFGGRMVDQTDGRIVALIREKVSSLKSIAGKIDVRRSELSDERSYILGAVAFALQELDFEA